MRLSVIALLLAATSLASGATAAREPWSLVRKDAIRSHVEFLASDLLEGRAAASRGHDIAAAYVASQFRQCALQPSGDDDSYFQTVPLLEGTPVLPGSSVELLIDGETQRFEYGMDYLPSSNGTVWK
jgi:hypothetical protein